VEQLAGRGNNIVCGGTAYGAGKVAANVVITGEPIDLDDGVVAVVNPNLYKPVLSETPHVTAEHSTRPDFISTNDWDGYLSWLIECPDADKEEARFRMWKDVIAKANAHISENMENLKDLTLLLWMTSIASSKYFSDWMHIQDIQIALDKHFASQISAGSSSIVCELNNYGELIQALDTLNRYGNRIGENVSSFAFQMLMSNFGLKSKFVTERFNEKGWNIHG